MRSSGCFTGASLEIGDRDYLQVFFPETMRYVGASFGSSVGRCCKVATKFVYLIQGVEAPAVAARVGFRPLSCQRNLAKVGVRDSYQTGGFAARETAKFLLRRRGKKTFSKCLQ